MTGDMLTYADDDRAPLETEWTWNGRLPRGGVVFIVGWRQSAKGLLTCNIAAHVTTGKPFPDETEPREPGDVIMVSAEDDANEAMAWRLRAAGADLASVHDLTEWPDGSPFELSAAATHDGDTEKLLEYIRMIKDAGRNPRMVILDPLDALVSYGSHKNTAGARRVIGRLQRVAKRTGVTIIVVHHLITQSANGGRGKTAGGQALEDAPRWLYRIEKDPMAPEYKVLHLEKHNNGEAEDIRYKIIPDGYDSRIEWVDRSQVEREQRAWRAQRNRKLATVIKLPEKPEDVARELVTAALETAGHGDAETLARITELDVSAVRGVLDALEAEDMVAARRKLSFRRG
jgi:KaiC/GvpD/RAD55 family RecA-like ATPase